MKPGQTYIGDCLETMRAWPDECVQSASGADGDSVLKNVIILMQSRTGSSMVASVFRAHGWLTGGDGVMSRGYVTHENQAVKAHLVRRYGVRKIPVPHEPPPDRALARIIETEFEGAPWCWKGDAYYAAPFLEAFSVYPVYVHREIPAAVKSSMDGRSFPIRRGSTSITRPEAEKELAEFLDVKYAYMHSLYSRGGGSWVYTGDVRAGLLRSIQTAITAAGGKWDEDAARAVIRPL